MNRRPLLAPTLLVQLCTKIFSAERTASRPDVRLRGFAGYGPLSAGFAARCEAEVCPAVGALLEVGAMLPGDGKLMPRKH
jgi:hypothetical protein